MNWIEEKIANEYMGFGFPEELAHVMAVGVVEKTIKENLTSGHRDLSPIVYIDGKPSLITTELSLKDV